MNERYGDRGRSDKGPDCGDPALHRLERLLWLTVDHVVEYDEIGRAAC